jgi:hypothetical protein
MRSIGDILLNLLRIELFTPPPLHTGFKSARPRATPIFFRDMGCLALTTKGPPVFDAEHRKPTPEGLQGGTFKRVITAALLG